MGASVSQTGLGSAEAPEPHSGLGPAGAIPSAAAIAELIASASVPHESKLLGAGRRTLSYYASVGIDHFGHDHARLADLFIEAARLVLAAMPLPEPPK